MGVAIKFLLFSVAFRAATSRKTMMFSGLCYPVAQPYLFKGKGRGLKANEARVMCVFDRKIRRT